jgi:FkbM family methyltransferase
MQDFFDVFQIGLVRGHVFFYAAERLLHQQIAGTLRRMVMGRTRPARASVATGFARHRSGRPYRIAFSIIGRDICPKGKLFVFEPRRISFQLLCANLTANGITHAHAYRLGVGAEKARIHEGPLPLDKAYNSGGPAIGALQGEGEAYDVVALDTMIEELGSIDLIKADVQGHEGALLRGASQLISTCRPLLYLENDERERSRALIEQVMALDYRLWWHAVPVFRQNNRGRTLQNIFGNVTSFNMLCIPAERVDALTPALAGIGGLQPMTDPAWFPVAAQS